MNSSNIYTYDHPQTRNTRENIKPGPGPGIVFYHIMSGHTIIEINYLEKIISVNHRTLLDNKQLIDDFPGLRKKNDDLYNNLI